MPPGQYTNVGFTVCRDSYPRTTNRGVTRRSPEAATYTLHKGGLLMRAVRTEVGVDWFSMSLPADKYPAAEWYYECQEVIERIADDGNEVKERTLLGYAGISVGNCFAGAGESSFYCQLSGSYAQRYWQELYRVEGHISRFDIQSTVFFDSPSDDLGINTLAIARNAAIGKGKKPKWTVSRVDDNSGGFSMYIGSKNSEQYLNLYNKEVESGQEAYKGAWRYELRLKNDYATSAAYTLFSNQASSEVIILDSIKSWLERKGVDAPWSAVGGQTCLYTVGKPKTDKETALWWLSNQVRPALDKARKLGYYTEACQALGLAEHPFYSVSQETGEVVNGSYR